MHRSLGYALIISMLLAFIGTSPAHAAGVVGNGTPESCDDAALDTALTGGGSVTFNCGTPVTITITNTKQISVDTTIDGGNSVAIDGQGVFMIFNVNGGATLKVNNLTLKNGFSGNAGAIGVNYDSTAIITNTIFSNNLGGAGAIISSGTTIISNSTFSNNSAYYAVGAIENYAGKLTIVNSTFSSNHGDIGGAIYNDNGTVNIIGTIFSNNSVDLNGEGTGGAIFNTSGTMNITNSTFIANSAVQGGGVFNGVGAVTNVVNSTFFGNSASQGGAIFALGGTVSVSNSILANSQLGGNCSGPITSKGHNISSDKSCSKIFQVAGDQNNINPLLSPLADNGGPTMTMALLPGSPAIDNGDNKICATAPVNNLDQRGVTRPLNGDGKGQAICDIGAFEFPTVTKPPK